MTTELKICSKCRKPKRERKLGSFTQWLLDDKHCSCDRISAPLTPDGAVSEICKACGRTVPSGRQGSMTQWIFGGSMCNCGLGASGNNAAATASVPPAEAVEQSPQEDEPELLLDGQHFPVDRYKAIAELGSGGSGVVYLCRDRMLKKKVAVKTLRQLNNEQLIAFQTEARATSKLDHPSILKLLDFGPTESGAPYMVLEYFNGITLEETIRQKGPLPLLLFKHVFSNLTSALSLAHKTGIFHRDIKPSNVLMEQAVGTNLPELKLIDFGVAQIKRETMPAIVVGGHTLTGTPAYMSPDTVMGREYDARSEIYSLGCVMFECLTGVPPFRGETTLEILNQSAHTTQPTLAEAGNRTFPDSIEKLVAKCLSKDPQDRFSSMAELNVAVQKCDSVDTNVFFDPDIKTRSERTKSQKKWKTIAIAACAIAILIGAGTLFFGFGNITGRNRSSTETQDNTMTANRRAAKSANRLSAKRDAVPNSALPSEKSDRDLSQDELKYFEETSKEKDDLEDASIKRDPKAQCDLAARYTKGDGVPQDFGRALYLYKESAKSNYAPAQNELGFMYQNGLGTKRDYKEALKWYRLSAEQNWHAAQANIGFMYDHGVGVETNYSEAFKWYKKAAAQKSPAAQNNLATLYENGHGVPKDLNEALRLYRLSAAQGFATAETNIANLYLDGRGVQQDYKEAVRLFSHACKEGDPHAHSFLAQMYEKGQGVKKDYQEAAKLYLFASEKGVGLATNNLGYMYEHGNGVERDYKKAMQFYKLAAEQGNPTALNNIGYLYEQGAGVKQDYKEAMKWYRKAVALNDSTAQNNLGGLYECGFGTKVDYSKAFYWYKKSAEQGNELGQNNLGLLYLDGKGVKQDFKEAQKWFTLSAEQGEASAINNLGWMFQEGQGFNQDFREAFKCYQFAALRGDPAAQYHLYEYYSRGTGVDKDEEKAISWLERAAAQGSRKAQEKLAKIRRK